MRPSTENVVSVPHLTDDDFLYIFQELYPVSDFFTINLCASPFYKVEYYQKSSRYIPLIDKMILKRDIEIGLQIAYEAGSDIIIEKRNRNLIPPLLIKINNK